MHDKQWFLNAASTMCTLLRRLQIRIETGQISFSRSTEDVQRPARKKEVKSAVVGRSDFADVVVSVRVPGA